MIMQKSWMKIGLVFGIIFLMAGASIVSAFNVKFTNNNKPIGRGNWLYVGGNGPGNYTTIQSAIDAASPSDTVFVFNGTYYEHVVINTNDIKILGENKNNTIIDGGTSGDVLDVSSGGLTISGFTMQNSGYDYIGLKLQNSNNNTIIYNNIIYNFFGVFLDSSKNNTITNNTANANVNHGIYLQNYSNNNTIKNNIATANNMGIFLQNLCTSNMIYDNIVNSNMVGILLQYNCNNNMIKNNNANLNNVGICIYSYCNNNTIKNNTVNANPNTAIQLCSSCNNTITNNTANENNHGIWLSDYSDNNTITNNIANSNFWNGLCIWGCNNNKIMKNILNYNTNNGIRLHQSANNTVVNNSVNSNDNGTYIDSSWNNMVTDNNANANNFYGFYLTCSNNNLLYHNNLVKNTQNAYDNGNNFWYNGYPSGGNYWGDYTGHDYYHGLNQNISGPDGIGDTSYNISGGSNQDHYPFMRQNGWLNKPPIANFSYNITGLSVFFNASSSNDPDGDITTWLWNFGDGAEGSGELVTHNYHSSGTYNVTLKVIDNDGGSNNVTKSISVEKFQIGFIFGKITNLSSQGEYIQFEAVKTRLITFSPFRFNNYVSGEKFTISKNYKGLVGVRYIFALCKIFI